MPIKTFVREKKIYCGENYKEVDIYTYTENQQKAVKGKRSKKQHESKPKQKTLNDKNARRYLVQLGNLNFGSDRQAISLTLTYNNANLPSTIEDAEKEVRNYLRRIQYKRKKDGLEALKYILVTAYTTDDTEKTVRIHHHLILNGGLNRETVEAMWTHKRICWHKWETDESYRDMIYDNKLGYANADRLQPDVNGITALCTYLARQTNRKKRWSSSQNLKKPTSRTNDHRYRRRQIEKLSKERPGREYWEKKYPGWTITDNEYGVTYEYNDYTGWAIYLKLRKRE